MNSQEVKKKTKNTLRKCEYKVSGRFEYRALGGQIEGHCEFYNLFFCAYTSDKKKR